VGDPTTARGDPSPIPQGIRGAAAPSLSELIIIARHANDFLLITACQPHLRKRSGGEKKMPDPSSHHPAASSQCSSGRTLSSTAGLGAAPRAVQKVSRPSPAKRKALDKDQDATKDLGGRRLPTHHGTPRKRDASARSESETTSRKWRRRSRITKHLRGS